MKKFLSVLLALAMMASLTVPALAAGEAGMTRGELAVRVVELCGLDGLEAAAAQPGVFTDVAETDACKAAADLLGSLGLMKGDGTGAFRPAAAVTVREAVTVLLRWAGLSDDQIGAWASRDSQFLAASLGLTADLDAALDQAALEELVAGVKPLYDAIHAETPAPYFVDGEAQPIFPYDTVVREIVYVETDVDSDGDGMADLLQVLIQRPAATDAGMKAAVIFEALPYSAGCTDVYDWDAYNGHIVNAELTEAKESTATTKADWDWKAGKAETPAPAFREVKGAGAAGDEPEVWEYTDRVTAYDYWLVRGYAHVSCSGLGTLGSDGFETCASADETAGFAAVIKWLAGADGVKAFTDRTSGLEVKADWCNGSVAVCGQSYGGSTAFALAASAVPGLKTIVPMAGIASWYDYYRSQGTGAGGLFYPGDDCDLLANYCMSRRFDEEDYATIQADYEAFLAGMIEAQDRLGGDYNKFWDERNYTNLAGDISCSALIVHGLNDFNVKPKQFQLMWDSFQTAGQTAKLILHQGAHSNPERVDGLGMNGILGRWYAHYLYGVNNGAEAEPAVRVQSNVDCSWATYDSWAGGELVKFQAPEGEKTFSSDLALTGFDVSAADVDEGWIEYCSDMSYDWEKAVIAGECGASAVYAFDVAQDLHIQGGAKATIRAKTDRATGILSAMLVELAPEGMERMMLKPYSESVGTQVLDAGAVWYGGGLAAKDLIQYAATGVEQKIITRGWMDIQNRTSIYNVDVVEPGTYYDFVVEFQPEDYVVEAGHQLALVVYSIDPEVTYWPAAVTNFTVDGAGTFVEVPVK